MTIYNIFCYPEIVHTRNVCSAPEIIQRGETPMLETLKNEIIHYIERMDEYKLRIVLGFVKKLLNL